MSETAAGEPLVQRHPFPDNLAKQVRSQFAAFSKRDFKGYTFERRRSDFKDARNDLTIFDGTGKLVLHGRDFGNRTFFWEP